MKYSLMDLTAIFKNLIIVLAIVIGGLWALYTFNAKQEVNTAKAGLDIVKRNLVERPVLVPEIEVAVMDNGNSGKWFLKVIFNVTNTGNTDTSLLLTPKSFSIAKVRFFKGVIDGFENIKFSEERDIPFLTSQSEYLSVAGVTILAGQTKSQVSVFLVDEPGLYKIEFNSEPEKNLVERRKASGEPIGVLSTISADEFVLVK